MLKFLRNKAGYGLIETIISICVLSTITITSMTLLTNMMSSLEFFRSNVVAQTLATSKVNLLSVADYASVVSEARAQVDTTYKLDRETVVNEVDLGGGNKKKDITINIYKTGAADTLFTMNYTLASAGAAVVVPHGQQMFTSSGTFTVPNGVTQVNVTCVGGAGGGGGFCSVGGARGGNGATGWINKKIINVTSGETVNVTIGTGGNGGTWGYNSANPGATGGTTSFGSYLSALGGPGGGGSSSDGESSTQGTDVYTYSLNIHGAFYDYSVGGLGRTGSYGNGNPGGNGLVIVEW